MVRRLWISLIVMVVLAFGGLAVNLIAGNQPALGLDLQGGISVTQRPIGEYNTEGLDLTVERIRERIDSLGVAEPEIVRQGDAIVVNLPGVKDQERALELVQVTGQVYLRPVVGTCFEGTGAAVDETTTTVTGDTAAADATTAGSSGETTATSTATTTATSTAATTVSSSPASAGWRRTTPSTAVPAAGSTTTVPAPDTGATSTALGEATTTTVDPAAPTTTAPRIVSDPTQTQYLPYGDGGICQVGPSQGTGEVFESDATARILSGGWGVDVGLRGGAGGEGIWNNLASQCYNAAETCPTQRLAIELDSEVISAPTVQAPVFSGTVQITGTFSESEAKELQRVLRSGSLPVRLETVAVENVSPTLGEDSMRAAIISGIVGVGLVLLFMVAYYRFLASVAIAGVAVSGALLWSVISILSKTSGLALSLAGIAGIIVSVGVTIDSYVVFFERIKDEVRAGRTMRNSAQRAFTASWRTILIADLVSLMGAAVLWYLTVGSVRNFAFFLGLSTLIDLFVHYYFTRPAVLLMARTKWMARRKVMGIEAVQPPTPSGIVTPAGAAT
jgi:preprotein translocase subunit SecD